MKLARISLLAIGLGVVASAWAEVPVPTVPYNTTQLIVKLKPGTSAELVSGPIGARVSRNLGFGDWYAITPSRNWSLKQLASYLDQNRLVEAVEYDVKYEMFRNVNDPDASRQWHLNTINSSASWNLTIGTPNVKIAIIDSGLDFRHPEFVNKSIDAPDFSDNDNSSQTGPSDSGHGTHCAGIAAANTNNGVGIAGVGYNSAIIGIKVFPNSFAANISSAIRYAADQGAKVISMSLGGYGRSQAMQDACTYAWNRGVVVMAAAGNDNLDAAQNPAYPANYDNVLSVASTTITDAKSGFSNYSGTLIDVAAPGSEILSTWPSDQGSYATLSGTSMACPVVAGVAGLAWGYAPAGTRAQDIVDAITLTSRRVGNFVKFGRVDAFRAVDYLTLSVPYPATLTQTGVTFGTQTSSNPLTIRSAAVNGIGQVAGAWMDYRMPSQPYAQLRSSTISFDFNPITGGTAQVYLWVPATSKFELVQAIPAANGKATLSLGQLPSKYISAGSIKVMTRVILPVLSGRNPSQFNFRVTRASAIFSYKKNP